MVGANEGKIMNAHSKRRRRCNRSIVVGGLIVAVFTILALLAQPLYRV